MSLFYGEVQGIYRLRVPFERIYTSVFLVVSDTKIILVDCATTAGDVDTCIVPALASLGYRLTDVNLLVLTHRHGDHAGGRERVLELAPDIEVVTSLCQLDTHLYTYPMAGHTEDSIGVLDTRTHTLISGDGLQGAGVDKYRCYTKVPDAYLQTLSRVQADKRIENILFSHAYEPWNTDRAMGRAAVDYCLESCKNYVKELKK